MRCFDLTSATDPACKTVLYAPDRTEGMLLITTSRRKIDDLEAMAATFASDSWSVLHIDFGPEPAGFTIADIGDAVSRAIDALGHVLGNLPIVAVAEDQAALPVAEAVLQSHRQAASPTIGGIVLAGAFDVGSPELQRRFDDLATELAELQGLASIVATGRSDTRQAALAYHIKLQRLGRESHFLVLNDYGQPLWQCFGDPRSPLGREIRWLLQPVHSRNPA